MIIQGKDGTPPADTDLNAERVRRLVGWSLREVLPQARRRGPRQAEWIEEVTAQANLAACQAIREFDPERGVGLPVFVRERVLAAVWTMYRREKSRRARFGRGGGDERLTEVAAPPARETFPSTLRTVTPRSAVAAPPARETFPFMTPLVAAALDRLPEAEKRLLVEIFWERRRPSQIAAEARVKTRAVQLRTQAAMRSLRTELRALARRDTRRGQQPGTGQPPEPRACIARRSAPRFRPGGKIILRILLP
jgi:DNA-directed RNA polymerase specialized sigma24 family protein